MIYIISCNYNQLEHMRESIKSVKDNWTKNVKYCVYDNASKDGSKEWLTGLKSFDSYCSEENIGKAKAMNWLVNEYFEDIQDDDLIISLDSDLKIETPDFFNKVEDVWSILKDKVSCLVCMQTGNSLYKRNIEFRKSSKGDFSYFAPSEGYGYGIAGGCLITPYKYWKQVGGYDENKGPNGRPALYGGADGTIFLDLYRHTHKPICIIKELIVFHPFEKNKEYQEWKNRQHKSLLQTGKAADNKGFFD